MKRYTKKNENDRPVIFTKDPSKFDLMPGQYWVLVEVSEVSKAITVYGIFEVSHA